MVNYSDIYPLSGSSSSIAGLTVGTKQTASFNALSNYFYEVESASNITATLPSSPSTNDKIAFILTSTGKLLINSNGNKVGGLIRTSFTLPKQSTLTALLLTYSGATNGWEWASIDLPVLDPYHRNVGLYLRGVGSNGSTTITDSSFYNSTVTNANITISTAQSPYGNSSIYFNGTNASLAIPINKNLMVSQSSILTIDFWYYPTDLTGFHEIIGSSGYNVLDKSAWVILSDNNKLSINTNTTGTGLGWTGRLTTPSDCLTLNQWQQITFLKNEDNYKFFVNGTNVGDFTSTRTFFASPTHIVIGALDINAPTYSQGYMSLIKITNAVKQSANFNPETYTYLF